MDPRIKRSQNLANAIGSLSQNQSDLEGIRTSGSFNMPARDDSLVGTGIYRLRLVEPRNKIDVASPNTPSTRREIIVERLFFPTKASIIPWPPSSTTDRVAQSVRKHTARNTYAKKKISTKPSNTSYYHYHYTGQNVNTLSTSCFVHPTHRTTITNTFISLFSITLESETERNKTTKRNFSVTRHRLIRDNRAHSEIEEVGK